jgi:hypothetical protein
MPQARCPKCSKELYGGVDAEDSPVDLARECVRNFDCPYVPCDDLGCKALENPGQVGDIEQMYLEWRQAAEHWRRHQYLCGCSHGR